MKSCPYCSASNWDDSPVCYACGRSFPAPNAVSSGGSYGSVPVVDGSPTQPVFQRPTAPYGGQEPLPYPTQPPQGAPAYQPSYPSLQPQAAYPPAEYIPPQAYAPPEPPAVPHEERHRGLSLLILGLAVVLVLGCGLLFYALASATSRGMQQAGASLSTQIAGVTGGLPAAADTPTPAAPEPTPFPTFTPEATAPPQDGNAPQGQDAAPAFNPEKLLSPECADAVNGLSAVSKQVEQQPTLALDADWRSGLERAVGQMRDACGSLDSASPVPSLVGDAQQHLSSAGKEFDVANRLFGEGVKEFNLNKLIDAGSHLSQATKDLNAAVGDFEKIGQ